MARCTGSYRDDGPLYRLGEGLCLVREWLAMTVVTVIREG
jgi:hypothetical protein